MSNRDGTTTTMSNLVDAGDDDVQIVNSMSHQSEHNTLAITTFNTSKQNSILAIHTMFQHTEKIVVLQSLHLSPPN